MRNSSVLGLFFLLVGGMFLALRPTYTARITPAPDGIEATAPLTEQRPYPDWVGPAAMLTGLIALLSSSRARPR